MQKFLLQGRKFFLVICIAIKVSCPCFARRTKFCKSNRSLGKFSLDLEFTWAGDPIIEITFEVNAWGTLQVTAHDVTANRERSMTISGLLSAQEVQRMLDEAAINAAADKKKLDQVNFKNDLSEYCHEVRKSLRIFVLEEGLMSN